MARGKRQRSPTLPPEDPVLPHHVWRNTPPEECRRLVGKAVPVLRNFLRIFWSKNIDTPKEFKRYFTRMNDVLRRAQPFPAPWLDFSIFHDPKTPYDSVGPFPTTSITLNPSVEDCAPLPDDTQFVMYNGDYVDPPEPVKTAGAAKPKPKPKSSAGKSQSAAKSRASVTSSVQTRRAAAASKTSKTTVPAKAESSPTPEPVKKSPGSVMGKGKGKAVDSESEADDNEDAEGEDDSDSGEESEDAPAAKREPPKKDEDVHETKRRKKASKVVYKTVTTDEEIEKLAKDFATHMSLRIKTPKTAAETMAIHLGDEHFGYFCMAKRRATATKFSSGLQTSTSHHKSKYNTDEVSFSPLELIDHHKIDDVDFSQIVIPRENCYTCVHTNRICFPIGFGANCVTCTHHKEPRCSHSATAKELTEINLEMVKTYSVASDVTDMVVNNFVNAARRMQAATLAYEAASRDMSDQFAHIVAHVKDCVEIVGSEAFLERFTRDDSSPSVIEHLNHLVHNYNDMISDDPEAYYGVNPRVYRLTEKPILEFDHAALEKEKKAKSKTKSSSTPSKRRTSGGNATASGSKSYFLVELKSSAILIYSNSCIMSLNVSTQVVQYSRSCDKIGKWLCHRSDGTRAVNPETKVGSLFATMPFSCEEEKYASYMLEDMKECETRLDEECDFMQESEWESFSRGPYFKEEDVPFGRHLFPYSQLLSHVHAVFLYFRRCYFNRIRKEYKAEIAQLSDTEDLTRIYRKWIDEDYSATSKHLVHNRLVELGVSPYFSLAESGPAPPVPAYSFGRNSHPDYVYASGAQGRECKECEVSLNLQCNFATFETVCKYFEPEDELAIVGLKTIPDWRKKIQYEHWFTLYPYVEAFIEECPSWSRSPSSPSLASSRASQ
ncbi:hypothetical protein B0H11DRAFT_1941040 [Mycena galericulata]|nr:hypothetical protein B0H11DRAFT_1941040 [Mycena galericulata]